MHDIMLDIETLDTRPSAVILSIGAIRFDAETPNAFGATFHRFVDIDSNLAYGRTVSGQTIMWWLDQDVVARKRLLEGKAEPLATVLTDLAAFITPEDTVWGNGASFDNVILADAFRSCGIPLPWRFWNDLCFRTLKKVFRAVPKPQFVGVEHDALDDATNQARHLQQIFQYQRNLTRSTAA